MVAGLITSAQTISKTLIAKMDISRQYVLFDGTKLMLMGFTELMSQAINFPGPTLEFIEGDSVDLSLINMSQSAPHTIHLHGLDVDQANDGVPSLSFEVPHLSTGHYYFKVPHPGTYIYHCHVSSPIHVQAGMYGLIIVRPSALGYTWDNGYAYHSEFSWVFSEIDTLWHKNNIIHHVHVQGTVGHPIPDYDPQYFMVNGKTETNIPFSGAPIFMNVGETVLVRIANIGYYGNIIRFPPGLTVRLISSDARPIPTAFMIDSLSVHPGERFSILIEADSLLSDSIVVEYFNLNTQVIENSQRISAQVLGYFGLGESENSEVKLTPNPASQTIILSGLTLSKHTYLIISSDGRLIKRGELIEGKNTISIESLSRGLYWVLLNESGQKIKLPLIVQ